MEVIVKTITTITGDGSMALKETVDQLQGLLDAVTKDLEKGLRGNKAAAQRVRTGTIKMEKIAKLYRKQSIAFEKTIKPKKKAAVQAAAKKAPAKKPAKKAPAKKAPAKKGRK